MTGLDSLAESSIAARRACDELSRRIRAGTDCRAEEFLASDPTIAADTDAALELLYTEFLVREQLGQQPRAAEWLDRFPQWREELTQLFEVHAQVNGGETGATRLSDTQRAGAGDADGNGPWDATAASGRSIGGYEILQEIGRGGMGVVYQARQRGLGRIVALKMILPPHGERERARFRAEAEATARLSHPNIVPIYEVGRDGDCPFLSMEFVDGQGLDKRLVEAVLAPRVAAQLLHTLARAVAYAHDQGIVHRDLKPANVLLSLVSSPSSVVQTPFQLTTSDGQPAVPKITDFGLAKTLRDGEATSLSGAIVGTPSYMPPEQCAPGGAIGPAVDVYALGAILYEALTGRPPFRGPTALDILELVRSHEPVPPSRLATNIPRDLETICLKCLAKRPEQRYANAGGLAEDLRRFIEDQPILARPVGPGERAIRWCRRNPLVTTLVGGIALLLVSASVVSTSLAVWALREKGRANHNAEQELAARDLAEQRFAQAEQAVEQYLDGIESNRRLQEADFFDLRKQLLTSAVPFYEEFVASKPSDEKLEAKRGRAYGRLGFVRQQTGEYEQATADYERMRDIFAQLHARGGEYRWELAQSHHDLAVTLDSRGLKPAAQAEYQRSLALYGQLVADFPAKAEYRRRLAIGRRNLGLICASLGKSSEATAELREALSLMTTLAADSPADIEYQEDLVGVHSFLAVSLPAEAREEKETHHRRAVALFQQLADYFPQRPGHRLGLATAHQNLAAFLSGDKRQEAAHIEMEQVLVLRKQLAAEFPAMPTHRWLLAAAHRNIGSSLRKVNRLDDAERELQLAITLLEQLIADFPGNPNHRGELALAREEQAAVLRALGKPVEAERELRMALPIRQQLASDFPAIPAHRASLAKCRFALAESLLKAKHLAEAETELAAAGELRKKLRAEWPEDRENLRLLAISLHNLGLAIQLLDRVQEAKAVYRETLPFWRELLDDSRFPADHRSEAARGISKMAALLKKDGDIAEARQLYTLAAEHQLQAIHDAPTATSFADYLRKDYFELADIGRLLKDHAATAAAAHKLGEVRPESADDAHWAARYFGRCIGYAKQDARLSEDERQALAQSYAEEAMKYLHEAVRRGYQDAAALQTLDALAPLQNRPDFQQLVKQLQPH